MSSFEHGDYTVMPFDELSDEHQIQGDALFTAYTRTEEAQKLAITYLDEGDISDKWKGAVAYHTEENREAAYAGAKQPVTDESGQAWSEVGTSITFDEDQRKGLGTIVAGMATRQVRDEGAIAVAFTNDNSRHMYVDKLGYRPAEEGEVPGEFFEACGGCIFREWEIGVRCCEAIVIHDGEFDESILQPDAGPDETAD